MNCQDGCLTLYDSLTGLPNRRYLMEQLHRRLDAPHPTHRYTSLLLIDLDRFKRINDTLSHRDGDRMLFRVAENLEDALEDEEALLAPGPRRLPLPGLPLRQAGAVTIRPTKLW